MRLGYLFAVAAGQEPSSIFQALAVDSKHQGKAGDTQRLTACGIEFITRRIAAGVTYAKTQSTAAAGTWDIYACLPIVDDQKAAKGFWKALDKARKDNANKSGAKYKMLGPWTAKAFDKIAWAADSLCYEQVPDTFDAQGTPITWKKKPGAPLQLPWVIAGDDPVQLTAAEYEGA